MAFATSETITGEASGAATVSDVGGFAERIERFAGTYGLVVEIASIATSANTSCVESFAEGIFIDTSEGAGTSCDLIAGEAGGACSIAKVIFAEGIDGDAFVVIAEVVTIGALLADVVLVFEAVGVTIYPCCWSGTAGSGRSCG